MNSTLIAPVITPLENPPPPSTRLVTNEWGTDREIQSSRTCCICNEHLWLTNNEGRQTIMPYSFNVLNSDAYVGGIVPDYLIKSNVLLQCHYTCKDSLLNLLAAGTFFQR